jgi:UDP-glucose 4-epimerase
LFPFIYFHFPLLLVYNIGVLKSKIFLNNLSYKADSGVLMSNERSVLVTGGAGYIGSHVALYCKKEGYQVVILDNYSQGQELLFFDALIVKGDYGDADLLDKLFTKYSFEAVFHCGAAAVVGASAASPLFYYENNVSQTVTLLQAMVKHNILRFIFSSSCAVYGIPQTDFLSEDHSLNPANPYGQTKLMIEEILSDCADAYGMEFVILRYFNACGVAPGSGLTEKHIPETHIIPILLCSAYLKIPFHIFGTNYNTPDGTCIRDYIHVSDIAAAHYKALKHLEKRRPSDIFNLGTGKGWSVKEVIEVVENVTQQKITVINAQKRKGDPQRLVADPSKALALLEWKPVYSDLTAGIASLLL